MLLMSAYRQILGMMVQNDFVTLRMSEATRLYMYMYKPTCGNTDKGTNNHTQNLVVIWLGYYKPKIPIY